MPGRNIYNRVPTYTDIEGVLNAIVEIPKGRRNKFEIDKQTGMIRLDRYLYSSAMYPGDYGFIPRTLAEDGDPLDILVQVNEATFSGCLIEARVVGLFRMKDRGVNDFKVLAVPHTDPMFAHFQDLHDVPRHFLREVEHFFLTYKQLEGATIESGGWVDRAEATAELTRSVERFEASAEGKAWLAEMNQTKS